MKDKNLFTILAGLMLLYAGGFLASCSGEGDDGTMYEPEFMADGYSLSGDGKSGGEGGGEGGSESGNNTSAGVITAAEWSDLNYWPFWSKLMMSESYGEKSEYWQFYTNNRVAVEVTDLGGSALAGVSVKLLRNDNTVWEAVTDNHGKAECWIGLLQKEDAGSSALTVSIDGRVMSGTPVICPWDSLQGERTGTETVDDKFINRYSISPSKAAAQKADIAFVVDATGSMSDEINFLKSDLDDIINNAAAVRPELTFRTGAVFYRDNGDEYLTRHSDFTGNLSVTREFVSAQNAAGGGDYPEAVHSALEAMLQNLSWDTSARTRLAFLILDAPAHHENSVILSLQRSVTLCARMGIRIIPVAASGVDKNTEFMLRFFAVATGGTYVFLTDDSGVGNSHIEASVGPHKVEQLNSLIIGLIGQYTE